MPSLRTVGTEISALGLATLSLPFRPLVRHEHFDPDAAHRTPVVLVHGFLGDPTNFLRLRGYLAARGMRNFAAFSYPPRLDYRRLARRLGQVIDTVRETTGADGVDLVGHSLGGLVARELAETAAPGRVRRVVSLAAPYFATPMPANELAVYGEADPFVSPPHPVYGPHAAQRAAGRVVVLPECGHWGLLYHPPAHAAVHAFLAAPATADERPRAAVGFTP